VRLVPAFAARSSACQAGPPRWKMVIRTKIPADHPFRSRMTDNRSMDPRVARAHETTARVTTIAEVERPTRYATRVMEQIEAEKALRESEARFRELADNISQFAWTADQTGWIYWYNKRWHDYTGTTLKEMEGWGWQKVHHPRSRRPRGAADPPKLRDWDALGGHIPVARSRWQLSMVSLACSTDPQ
jgi:PAS domain-containing protein